jgi:signal transduction histidine kinase
MRWAIAAACLTTAAIGLAVLIKAPNVSELRLSPGGVAVVYLGVVAAWGFVGVGAFAHARRPENHTGGLMVLVGTLIAITGLQFFDEPLPFAIGAIFDTVTIAVLIHLLLAFPSGNVHGRWTRRAVISAYVAGALQLPGLMLTRCLDCPADNPLLVLDNEVLATLVGIPQATLLLFALVTTVYVLLKRRQTASPLLRRGLEPVLLLGATILVLGLMTVTATELGTDAAKPIQIAFFGSAALFPAAFLLGLVRTRFFRTAAVSRVIERLSLDPRGVRDALATELADPTLEILYWVDGTYVDRDGHPRTPDGPLTEIDHEGRRVGALSHDPALNEEPELLRDAAAAAALALENQRLEVELRARLEALRASRARLVEAGDAERRRLGRDLHDGAQQRLVALMIELQLAREHFESDPATAKAMVDSALNNAQEAVHELRDLAAGIHPAVLSQRGLDAALESLASRASVPVELDSSLPERLPSPVETAAYFVVAEALTNVAKYAQATHAHVEVRRENGHAVIAIRDDGIGGADATSGTGLRGLSDRVGALDGALEIHSRPGEGTLIRARIPT